MAAGPRFLRFFWPIISTLREFGGSAQPSDVVDRAIEMLEIGDDERAERTKGGTLRVLNQAHWARRYLVWADLIDGSQRGRWSLTKSGWNLPLDEQDDASAHELFKRVRAEHSEEWGATDEEGESEDPRGEREDDDLDKTAADDSETALVDALRSTVLALSPAGFENLCKRLLTELGLIQLRTVGQAGDRGIDVEGFIRVSSVISFRVGVQCKLYSDGNKIPPRQIRELQGALGPFDRGIFMTTSVFTNQAEEQATSPGYKPIDLIDGERLIDLLLDHDLGIKQTIVVDEDFFDPFR